MLLYGDTPHCSVPSLSHAAAGKHQWERNTPQCLPADTVVLPHNLPFMASTRSTHRPDSPSHPHASLLSWSHGIIISGCRAQHIWNKVLLTTIKSANYSVTAHTHTHTPETTRNEYNVRVSLHAVVSDNVKYIPTTDVHQQQVIRLKEQCIIFGNTDMLVCHLCMARWSSAPLSQSHRVQRSTCYDGFNQAYSTKTAIRDCWHSSIKSENYTYKQLQSTYLRVVTCCSM